LGERRTRLWAREVPLFPKMFRLGADRVHHWDRQPPLGDGKVPLGASVPPLVPAVPPFEVWLSPTGGGARTL